MPKQKKIKERKINKVQKLALELQNKWIKDHNDWRTPVWGYFRDEAERVLANTNIKTLRGRDNN